jgi:RHS repeat-associated protein
LAPTTAGGTVSLTTGTRFFTHTDAVVEELRVSRTFNSGRLTPAARYGSFGPGWNSSLDLRLNFPSTNTIEVRTSDGLARYYFDDNADGVYQAVLPYSAETWIETIAGGYRRRFRAGGQEDYDSTGKIVSVTEASAVVTSYSRDGQGRLSSIGRLGRSITIAYADASSRPWQLLDGSGALLAIYEYTASSLLDSVTYPDGSGYRYTYDASNRVLSVMDLEGKWIESHTYDGSGRALTSEIGEGVERLSFSYAANQTTVTDALGNATVYDFANIRGTRRVTKVTGPCPSCGGGGGGDVQQWAYDEFGNITSYTNGLDKVWSYTYNASGDLLTETDPLNQVTTYTYDSQGRVLTRTGPDGSVTTYTHGTAGPLTITEKVSATQDRTTTLTYNSQGKPATITDPRGKVTTLAYNSSGDLTSATDPLNHATSFGYDALGRRTTVTDALNNTTTTSYDGRGHVTRITSPDGTHSDFTYDLGGRRKTVSDPLNRTTSYLYDSYGRLDSVVDALNGVTRYGYDLMSNLTSLTDAKGQTTSFEYDSYRRVKKVIYPGGAFESFTYDAAGRLATRVDRKSVTTTYSYDVANRLTGKSYSDGTPAVTYTYDPGGRLATAGNGTDSLTWSYDLAGQLVSEVSTKNASTVAYTYDLAGNRLSVSLDGQVVVSYGYDDASRLTTITRGSNVFSFGYDNVNRRTSLGYPNGVATSYTYDTLSRLTNLSAMLGQTTITQWGYTYDAVGNRTQKSSTDHTENYSYDPLYRLTESNRTGSIGAKRWLYGYDPVGNRTREQIDDNVTTPSYNEKNQLTSTTVGGLLRFRGTLNEPGTVTVAGQPARMLSGNTFEAMVSVSPGTNTIAVVATDTSGNSRTNTYQLTVSGTPATHTYDANGNLTQKVEGSTTWTYEWNAENQLKRVLQNGNEMARYAYDPIGRRVEKIAGGATTTWTYDGRHVLREQGPGVVHRYVRGPEADEQMAFEDGNGVLSYLHADGLGSVVKVTNATGGVVTTYRYDSYGTPEIGSSQSGVQYTGREWDAETGLFYYRARYYDPKIGRFISEDPIDFDGGDNNFYAYVANNPINFKDPTGLQLECVTKRMLVTAYCDRGPGSDWPFFKPKKKGGRPGSVGPGTCAAANTNPPPYPYGSKVFVLGAQGGVEYSGEIHDTGSGWNCQKGHHCVPPDEWLDIWLPCKAARHWGKQWREVLICRDKNDCPTCP